MKTPALKIAALAQLIGPLVVLLILIAVALPQIYGLWRNSRKIGVEIAAQMRQVTRGSAIDASKTATHQKIDELIQEINQQQARFFASSEEVISALNRLAEESGIGLRALTPLEKQTRLVPATTTIYEALPLILRLRCGFYPFLSFVQRIEQAPKVIYLTDFKLQGTPQDIWEHDIELTLVIPLATEVTKP